MAKEFRYVCDGCGTATDYEGIHYKGFDAENSWANGWTFLEQERVASAYFCPTCFAKMKEAIPILNLSRPQRDKGHQS